MSRTRSSPRRRRLIADYAGSPSEPQKRNMVYNRLGGAACAPAAWTFGDYLDLVQREGSAEREAFVNALTTNLTPSSASRTISCSRARERARARRAAALWSSACSTGRRPGRSPWCCGRRMPRARSWAPTSIPRCCTARGRRLPATAPTCTPERLRRHFLRGVGDNEGLVTVRPDCARWCVRPAQPQAPRWRHERFDAIFCRNVVIYFDREFQKKLGSPGWRRCWSRAACCWWATRKLPARHPGFRSCGRRPTSRRPGDAGSGRALSAVPLLRLATSRSTRSRSCPASTTPRAGRDHHRARFLRLHLPVGSRRGARRHEPLHAAGRHRNAPARPSGVRALRRLRDGSADQRHAPAPAPTAAGWWPRCSAARMLPASTGWTSAPTTRVRARVPESKASGAGAGPAGRVPASSYFFATPAGACSRL